MREKARVESYWPPTLFGVVVLVAVLIMGRSPSKPAEVVPPAEVPPDAGAPDAGLP